MNLKISCVTRRESWSFTNETFLDLKILQSSQMIAEIVSPDQKIYDEPQMIEKFVFCIFI